MTGQGVTGKAACFTHHKQRGTRLEVEICAWLASAGRRLLAQSETPTYLFDSALPRKSLNELGSGGTEFCCWTVLMGGSDSWTVLMGGSDILNFLLPPAPSRRSVMLIFVSSREQKIPANNSSTVSIFAPGISFVILRDPLTPQSGILFICKCWSFFCTVELKELRRLVHIKPVRHT